MGGRAYKEQMVNRTRCLAASCPSCKAEMHFDPKYRTDCSSCLLRDPSLLEHTAEQLSELKRFVPQGGVTWSVREVRLAERLLS
jgi:hypothetical protein